MTLFELFVAGTIALGVIFAVVVGVIVISGLIAFKRLVDQEDDE